MCGSMVWRQTVSSYLPHKDRVKGNCHRGVNAGGFCHRRFEVHPDHDIREARTVWFSDEFTARYKWTYYGNFNLAAAVRGYSWLRCGCRYSPMRNINTTSGPIVSELFHILGSQYIGTGQDGSMNVGDFRSQTILLQVLPPQTSPKPPSGTCGSDGR